MVAELDTFRQKYPQYADISDADLADRLAAKYPEYRDLPAKVKAGAEPEGMLGKVGKLGGAMLEAGYTEPGGAPRKETELLYSPVRPLVDMAKGVWDVAKEAPSGIAHSLSFGAVGKPMQAKTALSGIGNALLLTNPELIPLMMGASTAGEAVYGLTGNPKAAGATELIGNFISPSGLAKLGAKLSGRVAAKDTAKMEKAVEAAAQTGGLLAKEGIPLQERELAALKEEAAALPAKQKAAVAQLGPKEPAFTSEKEPAAVSEETVWRGREAAGMEPGALKTTPTEFGKRFQQFENVEEGVKPGIFQRGRKVRRAQAEDLYSMAAEGAEDVAVDAGKIGPALQQFLEKQGIALQIVPTRAETLGKKMAKSLGAVEEEENAFRSAFHGLSEAQQKPLIHGGVVPGQVPREVVDKLMEMVSANKGKANMHLSSKAIEEAMGLPSVAEMPERLSASDVIGLRQRVSGLKRAAFSAKNNDLGTQYAQLQNALDAALPPEMLAKLKTADRFYAEKYVPLFGSGSELSKVMQAKDPSEVFKSIVQREGPERVEEFMSFAEPVEKAALRGAFHEHIMGEATTRFGFDGQAAVKAYDKYSNEVKQALLGAEKPAWDDAMNFIAHKSEELPQAIKRVETAIEEGRLKGAQAEKALAVLNEAKTPFFKKTGFLERRMYFLAVFAALDFFKAAAFGTPTGRYGWADLTTIAGLSLVSNPRIMGLLSRVGDNSMRKVADVLTTRVSDPTYLTKVMALEELMKRTAALDQKEGGAP